MDKVAVPKKHCTQNIRGPLCHTVNIGTLRESICSQIGTILEPVSEVSYFTNIGEFFRWYPSKHRTVDKITLCKFPSSFASQPADWFHVL